MIAPPLHFPQKRLTWKTQTCHASTGRFSTLLQASHGRQCCSCLSGGIGHILTLINVAFETHARLFICSSFQQGLCASRRHCARPSQLRIRSFLLHRYCRLLIVSLSRAGRGNIEDVSESGMSVRLLGSSTRKDRVVIRALGRSRDRKILLGTDPCCPRGSSVSCTISHPVLRRPAGPFIVPASALRGGYRQ